MWFAVVPTHVKGKRRSKADMGAAEQFTGELTITQMENNSSGRPLLVAYLTDPKEQYRRSVMHPLFDVRVVKLTPGGIHLVGYQIEDSGALEVVQGWWAKFLPVAPGTFA